jgi:hypothetical protein
MEAIGDQLAEFSGSPAAPALVPDGSLDAAPRPGATSHASRFVALGGSFVRPPHENGVMEAIGERPEYYSGNVVVLGRAGVATPAAPSGLNDPVAGSSGSLPGSYAYDDRSRLSPGWRGCQIVCVGGM